MLRETQRLRGKKVAVLTADGFEHVELTVPHKALTTAGAQVEIISLHAGKIRGMNLTEPAGTVEVDCTLEAAREESYDALFIPGGFVAPDFLRQSARARALVRAFDQAGKPLATLCHGPWLLVSAELVSGRRLTAWPGIRDDIVHAGGVWLDKPIVRDRNWLTSRGPHDLHEFVPAMLELFEWGTPEAEVSQAAEGASSSPKTDEPPALAAGAARILPSPMVLALGAAAVGTAVGALAVRRP